MAYGARRTLSALCALMALTMLTLLMPVPKGGTENTALLPLQEPAFVEDFDDNYIDPYVWDVVSTGYGGSIEEAGQELRLTLASDSHGDWFGVGIRAKFKLKGDFDIQIRCRLITWPERNGVRAHLKVVPKGVAESTDWSDWGRYGFAIARAGAGWGSKPWEGYERYSSNFKGDIVWVPTSDTECILRLVRTGDTIRSYYWNASLSAWVMLNVGTTTAEYMVVIIEIHSHDGCFGGVETVVTFDDLTIHGTIVEDEVPRIGAPSISPSEPYEGEPVVVSVSVEDSITGVDRVTLYYRTSTTASWTPLAMSYEAGLWKAIIPGQPAGTTVEFYIEAYDKAGNAARTLIYAYTVKAKPTPPEEKLPSGQMMVWVAVAAGLGAGIGGAAIAAFLLKRKKP